MFGGEDRTLAFSSDEDRRTVATRPADHTLGHDAKRDQRREAGDRIPSNGVIDPLEEINPDIPRHKPASRVTRGGINADIACTSRGFRRAPVSTLPVRQRTEEDFRISGMGSELESVLIFSPTAQTSASALTVTWAALENEGRPPVTDYDLRWCAGSAADCAAESDFTEQDFTGTGTSATVANRMAAGATFRVQVRATNEEGTGAWSPAGLGTTVAGPAPLVSNAGQVDAGLNSNNVRRAQAFTTGSNPGGYGAGSLTLDPHAASETDSTLEP